MKIHSTVYLIAVILLFKTLCKAQDMNLPKAMIDFSYANKYSFFNSISAMKYSNGDVLLKLKNDFDVNAMAAFARGFKSDRHKLYGGIGVNYSEYLAIRNIFLDQYFGGGHFPMQYSYRPDKLQYTIQTLRFRVHLNHYTFYKRIMLFQKIGLAYTSFIKKNSPDSQYEEKYGNSIPTQDADHITSDNPNGWYFRDNYTYSNKNDLDIYKNGVTAFYRFGLGIRIKNFTPYISFEASGITRKFPSFYVKGQVGINYSFYLSRDK
jgi:hypothetical protein